MRFKIPYYAQSSEFTCGPACVLMVFKHFDPHLKLNRTLEFEVWRQCNMIGVRGADPFGMSVPLLDAGYEVRLVTQRRRMIDPDLWRNRLREYSFTPEEANLAVFGISENRKRALRRGLTVEYDRMTVERVARSFGEGFIPVALVHMGVVHQLDIPHWVVVTDAGEDHMAFNDPYPPKGGKGIRVGREEFQKMLDDVGTRSGLSPSVIFIRNYNPVSRSAGSEHT
ncbi:MAG: GCN5-related N-acetyltransferase [uncultured bacterium]|nr:MAG: GCN5-related N-acetyltransferase [uncultured bacterium]